MLRRALLLGGGAQLGLWALGACGGSTGGKLLTLELSVQGGAQRFTNDHGWDVSLDKALCALAAVQLYAGESEHAFLERLVSEAHAHPGHYEEGAIMGEVLEPLVVDLASALSPLVHGRGMAGHVGSAHLVFAPADLDGYAVWLEGEARRDGDVRRFRARASEADVLSDHGEPEIWACPFSPDTLGDDGDITLTIAPELWLAGIRFELLADGEEDLQASLHETFVAGVLDREGYVFSFTPVG